MFYKIIRESEGKTIAIKDYDDKDRAYKALENSKVDAGMISTLYGKEDFIKKTVDSRIVPRWYWIAKKLGNGQIVYRDIDPFNCQDLLLEDLQGLEAPNK
jgi:hypothetical protein